MSEPRSMLERELERLSPPRIPFDQLTRRRDRKRRAQRIRAGVVGLAIAIGVALLGFSVILHGGPRPAIRPEPTPGPNTGITLFLDEEPGIYFVDVRTGEATTVPESITEVALESWDMSGYQASPDGSMLLFIGAGGDARAGQVFVANSDGTGVRRLTDDLAGAAWASWSPDGSEIVYVEAGADDTNDSTFGSELLVIDVATGETTVLRQGADGDFQFPRFRPDGERILFTRRPGEIRTILATGKMETEPLGAHGGLGVESRLLVSDGYDAVYSPDGTAIAFHRDVDVCLAMCHGGTLESQIWFADADGGNPRPFGGVPTSAPRWSPDGSRIAFGRAIRSDGTIAGVPIGSTGPGSESPIGGTVVFDPATGDFTTIVNAYALFGWLDDRTLIVQILSPELV